MQNCNLDFYINDSYNNDEIFCNVCCITLLFQDLDKHINSPAHLKCSEFVYNNNYGKDKRATTEEYSNLIYKTFFNKTRDHYKRIGH